jgi:hypothetical protein
MKTGLMYNLLLDQFQEDVCLSHPCHPFPNQFLSIPEVSQRLRIRTVELFKLPSLFSTFEIPRRVSPLDCGFRCYLDGSVVADLGFHQTALQVGLITWRNVLAQWHKKMDIN